MPRDVLDLALEEHLDELDPLRHLREDDSDEDGAAHLVPVQPPSIRNQSIELAFHAFVLGSYIARKSSLRGKNVLELGSGTGLVGLVAGALGAHVWITDQAPLLGIMKQNTSLNHLASCVTVTELNWGGPIPADIPKPDLILAADCVYFEPAFPLLVHTLAELVSDRSTEVLFCYKKRRKADKRFFTLLKKEFTWEEVADDPERQVYAREAISLLRLYRK
ncbi:putative methyltransferase-domain-containing protein [Cerioporus squamosus]|nr:putative methyltransferase-domain-containing protein [Cerioporus squamosus]